MFEVDTYCVVDEFTPISLEEMDSVKLMDRIDTKYILSVKQMHQLLQEAKENYKILEIENIRGLKYRTTYFDTDDYEMFNAHQNGKLNRFKVRTREYVDDGCEFLEIKKKNNKGRTCKKRILRADNSMKFCTNESRFVRETSPFKASDLYPKLWSKFSRYTLVHRAEKERITIDFNLVFKNDLGKEIKLPSLSIIEVKQEKFTFASDFLQLLKKNGVYETRMSKYCIGSVLLNPKLKYNRFKEKLLKISKYLD